jgi:hypothetical protein
VERLGAGCLEDGLSTWGRSGGHCRCCGYGPNPQEQSPKVRAGAAPLPQPLLMRWLRVKEKAAFLCAAIRVPWAETGWLVECLSDVACRGVFSRAASEAIAQWGLLGCSSVAVD